MRVTWEARNGFSMIHVPPIFVPEVRTHSMATQGGIRTHISISSRIAVQVVDCKQEGWLAVKGKTHCLCLHYRAFACSFAAARCKHGSWTKQLECASKSRHLPWEQLRSAVASASLRLPYISCMLAPGTRCATIIQYNKNFTVLLLGGVQWISRHMLHTTSADSGAPRHRCSQHLAAASAPTKIWKTAPKKRSTSTLDSWHSSSSKVNQNDKTRTIKNPCLWLFDPSFARRISFRAVCAWPGRAKQNKQRPTGGYGILQHHCQPRSEIGNPWKQVSEVNQASRRPDPMAQYGPMA